MNKIHRKRRTELTIFVFNPVEDEWSFIRGITDPRKRRAYIADCESDTDCYFLMMSTESDCCFISPKSVPIDFQNYARSLFNSQNMYLLIPKLTTHLICNDFVADAYVVKKLLTIAKGYKRIKLVSYTASEQFYTLKERLELEGLSIRTPEAPAKQDAWTVNFFGSKSGIRQLSQMSTAEEPDFRMANGLICSGRRDAAKIAALRYLDKGGVVIKTNKGCAGNGIYIFREGDLPRDYTNCEEAILQQFTGDSYWDTSPIVIEDLIHTRSGQFENYPNIEFNIDSTGSPQMLYVCNCKVTPKGHFLGVDIGREVLSNRVRAKVEDMGYYIADQYSEAGYRGRFDVDMMLAKNRRLYVNESNTRYTGGTDTYKVVRTLIGKDFMNAAYIIARSRKGWLSRKGVSFSIVHKALQPILYDPKTKEGLIIQSSVACLEGYLTYLIISTNKKCAYFIERKLRDILMSLYPSKAKTIKSSQ